MRALLCVLLIAAGVLADESETRRSKLPYIADAVGNTLPPPSSGPATVGSPVNLITPDRYEFYTFDESGELVKRLMTLEEIQAIVAAGEETEGLVTFANENQPTIAFNFSQPAYTKVHNVVTNVQNVLKAQMEAHKNKPQTQPTLDTPDVSDSWSLILPSIFGNTGVDIVPDKSSGTFTTPETETIEIDRPIDDNSLSKEGVNQILSSSTTAKDEIKETSITQKIISTTENIKAQPKITTTTTTTSRKPISTTTSAKPATTTTAKPATTTTAKPVTTTTANPITTTTAKPVTTTTAKPVTTTTAKPVTTTTAKPLSTTTTARPTTTTKTTTAVKHTTTTSKPTTAVKLRTTTTTTSQPKTTTTTTSKPRTTTAAKPTTKLVRTTSKPTTFKPDSTTRKPGTTLKDESNFTKIQVQTVSNNVITTEKSSIQYEKISTFIPLSTAALITERSTQKSVLTPKLPTTTVAPTKRVPTTTRAPSTTVKVLSSASTYKPSSIGSLSGTTKTVETEKFNATTVTTQSVSPSTTPSSTEFVSLEHHSPTTEKKPTNEDIKENKPDVLMFDVAQSFSQIASDLGGNFGPLPTSSDLLDTTKLNEMNLESKENVEIDIPVDNKKETEQVINTKETETVNKKGDNFVKISTIEPHSQVENKVLNKNTNTKIASKITSTTTQKTEVISTTTIPITTTIDPVLSESMDDLLSQIVNQAPTSILSAEKHPSTIKNIPTVDTPTTIVTTMKNDKPVKEEIISTTPSESEIKAPPKVQEPASETNKVSNEIPEVVIDSRISDKVKNEINLNKEREDTTNKPIGIIEEKQNLVKIAESTTKKEKPESAVNIKVSDKNESLKKETGENKNKNEIKIANDKIESINKMESKPVTNEENNNFRTTTSSTSAPTTIITTPRTENPPKMEPMKKPSSVVPAKKPVFSNKNSENVINNVNKISTSDNNKIINTKEKEKAPEPLPKIDEFKKKIQKVNIDDKELMNERNNSWKLISTVTPPKANEVLKDKHKSDGQDGNDKNIVLDFSKENQGLEVTTKDLSEDISQFTELCNELAFRYWHAMTETIDKRRSFVLSPYSITSMLAMMFMGARGATSGEMNEILKLDDMVTFNPHFTLKNISDSIETNPSSGVIVSAFIRELFSDRSKGKILTFYKERAQHFYNGHVEEINFKLISDIIRRRTNLLVKRYTYGKIVEYMKSNTITMQPPLAAFSANIFQTDCSGSSVEGRDGEMYFVVSPNVRQRRLVPVPSVVYRNGFLAGYDPVLDATAAALGNTNSVISTLFLMPGQQGNIVHAEDLEALEKRLLDSDPTTPAWNRLLRTLLPRMGLELQIPRFSHKSLFNVSTTLKKMGLKELFDPEHADLGGLNGPSKDLYLSDMVQSTTFVTCGEDVIGEQHHIEEYPETLLGPQRRRTSRWAAGWDEPRDYQRAFHDPHDVGDAMNLPLHLRPRQARLPARNAQPARLKFDRPFLFFVRHNPSGMILYVGRYNPRLLP